MISGSGLMHWKQNCERNSSSFLCCERYSVKMMSKHFYILQLYGSRKRMWCPHGEPSDAELLLMQFEAHGPLTRYVKLRVVHVPGMPGTFSPPLTSKETASLRSRHASRHELHARAVMHVEIANPRWRGKRSPHSRHMHNPQFYVSGEKPMTRMSGYFGMAF